MTKTPSVHPEHRGKVPLRVRGDLVVRPIRLAGADCFLVKDPITFRHFRFSEAEFYLLSSFDGQRSLVEIQLRWRDRFASNALTIEQIKQFAQRVLNDQLVSCDLIGRSPWFSSLARESESLWLRILRNPIAIKFRGYNPRGLLRLLEGLGHFLFHPFIVCFVLTSALVVSAFGFLNFERLISRIPEAETLLTPASGLIILVAVACVKAIHELGHALACQKFGGECFEIGVMLLAGVPTLYTDVSDAWTVPRKAHRIMVSFAGIYSELILGTMATIAWIFLPIGLLGAICFYLATLCLISSLVVNGNPLLRYDGYFMLSDALDQPNLYRRANIHLKRWLKRLAFTNDQGDVSHWLVAYGAVSALYRLGILAMIVYAILTTAYALQVLEIGVLLCGLVLIPIGLGASRSLFYSFRVLAQNMEQLNKVRTCAMLSIGVTVVWCLLAVPLRSHVYCEVVQRHSELIPVYSAFEGRLVEMVDQGECVVKGDVVAEVDHSSLDYRRARLEIEQQRLISKIDRLESRSHESEAIATEILVAKEKWNGIEDEINGIAIQQQQQTITAPCSGVVFATAMEESTGQFKVAKASFENPVAENRFVDRGQAILHIGDRRKFEVIANVNEVSVGRIAIGQEVAIVWDRNIDEPVRGRVAGISSEADESQSHPGRSEIKIFEVSVALNAEPDFAHGATGRAKIRIADESLARKVVRAMQRLANAKL